MSKDFNMIKNIYEEYNNRHGQELTETNQAETALDKYLESMELSQQQKEALHDLVMAVACENERQGFYHGFAAGLELANELESLYRIK